MVLKKDSNILIRVEAYSGEHLVLRALIFALAACIAAYLYFVGLSIMNVISHREASVLSDRLRSEVGTLEKEYFELSEAVTPEMGSRLGLVSASNASYVRRGTGLASNDQGNF
jgi:hypothetical protein